MTVQIKFTSFESVNTRVYPIVCLQVLTSSPGNTLALFYEEKNQTDSVDLR